MQTFSRHILGILGICAGSVPGLCSNVISVSGGTLNTDYAIDSGGVVRLLQPLASDGVFTISADEDGSPQANDGYINAVILDSGAPSDQGMYHVRIATLNGSIYATGAATVGYIKIDDGTSDGRKGNLAAAIISGEWGVKNISGTTTPVTPGGGNDQEVTRIRRAQAMASSGYMERFRAATVNSAARFIIAGDENTTGWTLPLAIDSDFHGKMISRSSITVSSAAGSGIAIARDMGGEIRSDRGITGRLDIGRDLLASGKIIVNDNATAGGDIDARIIIGRKLEGEIRAKSGGTLGGKINGVVEVSAEFSGSIVAERGPIGASGYIALNSDGKDPGSAATDWTGTLTIGSDSYVFPYFPLQNPEFQPPRYVGDRVYFISNIHGDMDNSWSRSNFDIDPFVSALTTPTSYISASPHLERSMSYHGDMGTPCQSPDGAFNNFDIDCFVNCIVDNACPTP